MISINRQIQQINKNIDRIMAVDYEYVTRTLRAITRANSAGNPAASLKKLLDLQKRLRYSLERFQARSRSVPALHFPKDLPITAKKDEIITAIKNNQAVIITGETGSGKTTQIPKMCLAAGQGRRGIIGLTQPRRIAATSIAARIADEIGEQCGKSVAYKIRFDEKTSAEPFIKVMTDGILLAETVTDQLLLAYDTIIVDEAHERSINIDFILGFLRTLLDKRQDLKLIITSATIDTAKFSAAFRQAPVMEVSGRMYPVEVRYQPVDSLQEEYGESTYIDEAIACVTKLQEERRFDDILIFMPTEQDIRETCERLSKRCSGVVLPLYARLAGSQQRLVFEKIDRQKIIVATNIAETSLTVPGIKYVIDSGLARQLEYNPRSQTTGLPVKAISRSSAEQRKGRCGRVQNGICIRLYSADDYAARKLYTAPEIMRSNLAGVILRMLALNLGSVFAFPFIDSPHPKSIRDGIDILNDLGAIAKSDAAGESKEYRLTQIGRTMAQLPLDPRISRILIEAQKEGCIKEAAIIAAALSIQDPRERPYDKIDEAAKAHALFQNAESDFLTYLNIWNHYHDTWERLLTQNKLRKFCHEHFLSYRMMTEWRDIYQQIMDIFTDNQRGRHANKYIKIDINQEFYDKIHKCILSGYLSHIARKKEKNFYLAAKSGEVMIYPGSGLFNRGGGWIVAAEITQTSRLFARNIANIDPAWLEEIGKNHCRYSYTAAHWEKNRGQVVALEKVTIFGLTIVEARPVAYEKINPEEARAIFIREALVPGEINRKIPFLEHNISLWQKALVTEDKLRRRGIVADEETIACLYEAKLPVISEIRSLLQLIKDRGSDDFLRFREEDFLVLKTDEEDVAKYPDQIKIGAAAFPCQYNFAPGKNNDGVTMKIPLGLITKAAEENVERFLPGLLQEKTLHLLKTLPKGIKQRLPTAAQIADLFLNQTFESGQNLPQALSRFIREKYQVACTPEVWDLEKLPLHLKILYRVVDEKGVEIKESRDINDLKEELADKINFRALDKIKPQWEKEGITSWEFGPLPDAIPLTGRHGLIGYAYPALKAKKDGIDLRLFADQKEAENNHSRGIAALYELYFSDKMKQLKKNVAFTGALKTAAADIGNPKLLEQALLRRIKNDLFRRPWRSKDEFVKYADSVNNGILQYGQQVFTSLVPVLQAFDNTNALLQKLSLKNTGNNPLLSFLQETQRELHLLIPVDFPEMYSLERMKELPRYMKALALKAERGSLNLAAARKKMADINIYSQQLKELQKDIPSDTAEGKNNLIEELFWMIEEYKVSLFAQELKTPYPVSAKKLDQLIQKIMSF